MTKAPDTAHDPGALRPAPLPSAGGSYARAADGSLRPAVASDPAPAPKTAPKTKEG